MDGILNVFKERGFTSHDVVAKLRGITGQRKIGHTGTLDPDAEGVLPVCLGQATKLSQMLMDHDKEYEAVLLLGCSTDTQDTSGTVIYEADKSAVAVLTKEAVSNVLFSYIGGYEQLPPMYSAKKINGKKLYELARAGIEAERKPRRVELYAIDILAIELPLVKIRVHCGSGTYIRTLCHDIGEALGVGGCMKELLRTRAGRFSLSDASRLSDIENRVKTGNFEDCLISIDHILSELPRICVLEHAQKRLFNGNILTERDFKTPPDEALRIRVCDCQSRLIGVYDYSDIKNVWKPYQMFTRGN